jgi:hypothetical protein
MISQKIQPRNVGDRKLLKGKLQNVMAHPVMGAQMGLPPGHEKKASPYDSMECDQKKSDAFSELTTSPPSYSASLLVALDDWFVIAAAVP